MPQICRWFLDAPPQRTRSIENQGGTHSTTRFFLLYATPCLLGFASLSSLHSPTKLRPTVGIPSATCQTTDSVCQMTAPLAMHAAPPNRQGRSCPASRCVTDDVPPACEWVYHPRLSSPAQSTATRCRLPSPTVTPAHSSETYPTAISGRSRSVFNSLWSCSLVPCSWYSSITLPTFTSNDV